MHPDVRGGRSELAVQASVQGRLQTQIRQWGEQSLRFTHNSFMVFSIRSEHSASCKPCTAEGGP